MLQISELYIYPIKSLPGIKLQRAKVIATGFEHDRRWMLVDPNNCFITQREHAEMTQLAVAIEDEDLVITHKTKQDTIAIPLQLSYNAKGPMVAVTVWDDTCQAVFVSDAADKWFSAMLGINCRLVYMPDESRRTVDPRYAPADAITSFADAYPFLMIGQASLDDLNSRIGGPLPMDRFRPNIVFTGGAPYGEDLMGSFMVNGITFHGVKLCARCVMTTIDQDNAKKGKEPLKTLASYRFKNNKILFGQNVIHDSEGVMSIGDELTVTGVNIDERFMVPVAVRKTKAAIADKPADVSVQ